MATKRQCLTEAKRCFVNVMGTEFWVRTAKAEIIKLQKHLGGWHRLDYIVEGPPDGFDLYISVVDGEA